MSFLTQQSAVLVLLGALLVAAGAFLSFPVNLVAGLLGIAVVAIPLYRNRSALSLLRKEFDVKTRGFDALAEHLDESVIVYDEEFRLLALNAATEKMFGIAREAWKGKKAEPRTDLAGNDRLFIQILFPSLAASATELSDADAWPKRVEITTEKPSRKFLTSVSRVMNEQGGIAYFIKSVRDASEERETAEEKSEFVDVAAHQLRTPLTAINWALENIVKGASENPAGVLPIATEALSVSARSLKIVNDLLEVAKIESGSGDYAPADVALAPFLRKIVEAGSLFAKERSVNLFFQPVPPEWESASARIDEATLGTALGNLIDNAVKYNTKNGEARVRLEVFPERRIAKISIEDTGKGIAESDRAKLFKKFSRGAGASSTDANGTGLGLYIVKKIVERHGGQTNFESKEGRGSTFWVTLPLSADSAS